MARVKNAQEKTCGLCGLSFTNKKMLYRHRDRAHKRELEELGINCRVCGDKFKTRAAFKAHRALRHEAQRGEGPPQASEGQEEADRFRGLPDEARLEQLYEESEPYILAPHQLADPVTKVFNFPVKGQLTETGIKKMMEDIYMNDSITNGYKVNLAAGTILKKTHPDKAPTYRYFRPDTNCFLLKFAIPVYSEKRLKQAIDRMNEMNLDAQIRNQRDNTASQVLYITNIEWYCSLLRIPLGNEKKELPDFIERNKNLVRVTVKEGWRNMCMFICIAQHRLRREREGSGNKERVDYRRVVEPVKDMLGEWFQYCEKESLSHYRQCSVSEFGGIRWEDVKHVEECFKVNIIITELVTVGIAQTKHLSLAQYSDTVHMNVHLGHVSYIVDPEAYAKKYECQYCFRLFTRRWNSIRHERSCGSACKFIFPGSAVRYPASIFDRLEYVGIVVPESACYATDVVVYDFESILEPVESVEGAAGVKEKKEKMVHIHKPISVSVACSVDKQAVCIIEPRTDLLINQMLQEFERSRLKCVERAQTKWGHYLQELKVLITNRMTLVNRRVRDTALIFREAPANRDGSMTRVVEKARDLKAAYNTDPLLYD